MRSFRKKTTKLILNEMPNIWKKTESEEERLKQIIKNC